MREEIAQASDLSAMEGSSFPRNMCRLLQAPGQKEQGLQNVRCRAEQVHDVRNPRPGSARCLSLASIEDVP